MREHLLGYLLGALEPAECEQVERHLDERPELRRELELLSLSLAPLAADRASPEPPAALARRTCDYVALRSATLASSNERHADTSWRLQDLVVAAGIFLAAGMLFFPAVHHSRFQSRLAACQNNLRAIGQALALYSQNQGDYFPFVPPQGQWARAGIYAPTLIDNGFLSEPRAVVCPECPLAAEADFQVPSLATLSAASGAALASLHRVMGGSYGYTFGYQVNGRYQGTRNWGRPNFALVADAPTFAALGRASMIHASQGQNVLFEDGHVTFVRGDQADTAGDRFFVNDAGVVAAGSQPDDSVIGPSDAAPVEFIVSPATALPR